ncbi:hypothetical protein FRC09_003292 [Ceratobasidium sp. 395]|nr:hypothetical protein FRC09_003292 [Ceratobasidium sp. 395]
MSSTVQLRAYVEKLQSSDQNVRLAALQDLTRDLGKTTSIIQDTKLEYQIVQQVVALLADRKDEIQEQARECIGQLVKAVRSSQMDYIVTQLIEGVEHSDGKLHAIAGSTLKTLVAKLPQDTTTAPRAVRKITPVLLQQSSKLTAPVDTLIEALTTLEIVLSRFHTHIPPGVPPALMPLLCHTHSRVRKQAVSTIASYVSALPATEAQAFVTSKVVPSLASPNTPVNEKCTALDLVSALAGHATPSLEQIVPGILSGVKKEDNERLKYSSLQALEKLTTRCSSEIKPYASQIIKLGVKHTTYGLSGNAKHNGAKDHDMNNSKNERTNDKDLGANAEDEAENSDGESTPSMVRRSATNLLSAVISTQLDTIGNLYKVVAPALVLSSRDIEPSVQCASWSAFTALVSQTRQYFSDCSNFAKKDWGRFDPLPATKDFMTVVDTLVPQLLKGVVDVLSSKDTLPPSALQLLDALFSPLPKGSPQKHIFTTGYKCALKSQENLEEDLFLLVARPTTLATFSLMMTAGWPCGDALVELTTIMAHTDASVASKAIRLGLHRIDGMSELGGDSDFGVALQSVARKLLRDSTTDTTVQILACKLIGELLIHGFSCDDEDWELVRMAGAAGVIQETIWKIQKYTNERYEMAEEWLESNQSWCVELICDEEGGDVSNMADIISCLVTLLCESFNTLDSGSHIPVATALFIHLTPTDSALEPSLRLLRVLYSNRPKKLWQLIERKILCPLCSLASKPLPVPALDALAELMCILAELNGENDPDAYEDEDEDQDENEDDEDEDEDKEDGDSDEDEDGGSSRKKKGATTPKEEQDVASLLLKETKSAFHEEGAEVDAAKGVGKCIAAVLRGRREIAPQMVDECSTVLKPSTRASEGSLVLSILTLGKIASYVDVKSQKRVFTNLHDFLSSDSEHVRNAAAQAIGDICLGSSGESVPTVIGEAKENKSWRPLLLRSLEVFGFGSPPYQFEKEYADTLWKCCKDLTALDQDVLLPAASCVCRLIAKKPSVMRSRLEEGLGDHNPAIRALAISTIGCAIRLEAEWRLKGEIEKESRADEGNDEADDEDEDSDDSWNNYTTEEEAAKTMKKEFGSFANALLSALDDKNPTVKLKAVESMIDLVRNDPRLVEDRLTVLLSKLYGAAKPEVEAMDIKCAVYKIVNLLMNTPILAAKLDLNEVLTMVVYGVSVNSDEIKMLCHKVIQQLSQAAPTILASRMKEITAVLSANSAANRGAEATRSEFSTMAALNKIVGLKGNKLAAEKGAETEDRMDLG